MPFITFRRNGLPFESQKALTGLFQLIKNLHIKRKAIDYADSYKLQALSMA